MLQTVLNGIFFLQSSTPSPSSGGGGRGLSVGDVIFVVLFVIIFIVNVIQILNSRKKQSSNHPSANSKGPYPSGQKITQKKMQKVQSREVRKPVQKSHVPKKTTQNTFEFHSSIESYRPKSQIENRKLSSSIGGGDEFRKGEGSVATRTMEESKEARFVTILKNKPAPVAIILASEMLLPPKSMRR